MKNPLLKNNKTWLIGDLQHRTSHYNRILCARSTYKTSPDSHRQPILDHINCKFRSNSDRQRRITNNKLVNSLLSIDKKGSEYGGDGRDREPGTLKNYFIEKTASNKIMDENLALYRKIVGVDSEIGCKKRWRSRKKQLKGLSKILANKRQEFINLDQEFYSTYRKLREKKSVASVLKVSTKFTSFSETSLGEGKKFSRRERFFTEPAVDNGEEDKNF